MDLLLSHGYFLQEDAAERRIMKPYPPLGILYLSAYLKKCGFAVDVFDTTFRTRAEFFAYVSRERPTVVGLSSNLMTKSAILGQITFCKSRNCTVVVGGPDVPEHAEAYLEFGADVAVIGEGELTMAELLPALQTGASLESVAGIAFRNGDGTTVRTPPRPLADDLDLLPLPDRGAIDIDRYVEAWRTRHGMGSISLICARGCPFTCTWCSRSVFGESHRRRSPRAVVDEIEMLIARYKPDMLWFADDVFTIQHKWFHEFHAEMKRRGIRIPFECISRADRLNEEILRKMAEIGAFRIWYGSESGSQRILDAMKRRVQVEEIREITHCARRYGIQTGLFVMLGYPGEEIADIEETVRHLKDARPDTFLTTVAYPIKGTEFYSTVADRITSGGPWHSGSDRSLRISGRHSDRFYWFANRYLVNEVRHHALGADGAARSGKSVTTYVKARLARLGMELTKRQRS